MVRFPGAAAVPPKMVPLVVPLEIVTGPLMLPVPPRVPEFTCTAPVPVAEPVVFLSKSVPPLTAVTAYIGISMAETETALSNLG